jgi:hypothetical protein
MTMTEVQWLASTDPQEMLRFLEGKVSERKQRLFACAWWRSIKPHDDDHEVLASAVEEAGTYDDPRGGETIDPAWLLRDCLSNPRHGERGASLLRDIVGNPFRPWGKTRCSECEGTGQYELILVGSGIVPCPECDGKGWKGDWESELCLEDWLRWQDGTIPRLAQAIYDEQAFDRLPILADALQEAGCTNEDILKHCRGWEKAPPGWWHCRNCGRYWQPVHKYDDCDTSAVCEGMEEEARWLPLGGPHVRGCHVIDLLLGKS